MTMLGAENPILGNNAPIHRHSHHMVYATDASGMQAKVELEGAQSTEVLSAWGLSCPGANLIKQKFRRNLQLAEFSLYFNKNFYHCL